MSELRTPEQWSIYDDVIVIDPDGWRHDGKGWGDPISYEEWERRKFVSTIAQRGWA